MSTFFDFISLLPKLEYQIRIIDRFRRFQLVTTSFRYLTIDISSITETNQLSNNNHDDDDDDGYGGKMVPIHFDAFILLTSKFQSALKI